MIDTDLPDVSAPWVIGYWHECGTVDSSGMGATPLGWQSILAWQAATGTPLAHWEAVAIRRMSEAYTRMSHQATDPGCPSPASPTMDDDRRANISNKIRSALGGYGNANG